MAELKELENKELEKQLVLMVAKFDEQDPAEERSFSQVPFQSQLEQEALLAIEDDKSEAPEMKVRYHKKLKNEKLSQDKIKSIDKEMAALQELLEDMEKPGDPKRASKRQETKKASNRQKGRTGRYPCPCLLYTSPSPRD